MKKMIIVAIIVAMAAVTACSKVPAGYVGVKANLYESITFQTREGMSVNADVGISYHINRKGIEWITDIYLRNIVRDAFKQYGSQVNVESVYGLSLIHI